MPLGEGRLARTGPTICSLPGMLRIGFQAPRFGLRALEPGISDAPRPKWVKRSQSPLQIIWD